MQHHTYASDDDVVVFNIGMTIAILGSALLAQYAPHLLLSSGSNSQPSYRSLPGAASDLSPVCRAQPRFYPD